MASDPSKRPANGVVDQPRVKRSRFDTAGPRAVSNGAATGPAAATDGAAALEKAKKALLLGSDIKSRLAALKVRYGNASCGTLIAAPIRAYLGHRRKRT